MTVMAAVRDPLVDGYRGDQATIGNHTANAVGAIWDRSFSIKEARSSWASMRPEIAGVVKQYQMACRVAAIRYYNARRVQAGLGAIDPDKAPLADEQYINSVIDPCGLGAFLHMVKQGAMMEDASQSGRSSLASAVQRLVLQSARDTILAASKADPESKGWSRVTGGTCDYCAKLAASEGLNDGSLDFPAHDDCQCNIDPQFKGEPKPPKSEGTQKLDELKANATHESDFSPGDDPDEDAFVDAEDPQQAILDKGAAQEAKADELLSPEDTEARADVDSYQFEKAIESWKGDYTDVTQDHIMKYLADPNAEMPNPLAPFQTPGSQMVLPSGKPDTVAQQIAKALTSQQSDAPKLYRGMGWSSGEDTGEGSPQFFMSQFQVGGTVDFPPASWTSDVMTAQKFKTKESAYGSKKFQQLMIVLDDSRGLDIENIGGVEAEHEWITGGRYTVESIERVDSGLEGDPAMGEWKITLKQQQSLENGIELLDPQSREAPEGFVAPEVDMSNPPQPVPEKIYDLLDELLNPVPNEDDPYADIHAWQTTANALVKAINGLTFKDAESTPDLLSDFTAAIQESVLPETNKESMIKRMTDAWQKLQKDVGYWAQKKKEAGV